VFLGVYPKPVLDRIEPSVERLIDHLEANSDYERPETVVVVAETGAGGEAPDDEGASGR